MTVSSIPERNHLRVRVEGEAITSGEFLELLEEERNTQAKKGTRKRGTQRKEAPTGDVQPSEVPHY